MNTLHLTRTRIHGKLRWGWIYSIKGKEQYASCKFYTSKAKAEAHFLSLHPDITKRNIHFGVIEF